MHIVLKFILNTGLNYYIYICNVYQKYIVWDTLHKTFLKIGVTTITLRPFKNNHFIILYMWNNVKRKFIKTRQSLQFFYNF